MIRYISGLIRGLRQDLRSTELLWLVLALTLSVTALSSVSFLADRMQRTFAFDARQLLASDLLIASDQVLSEQFIQEAQRRNLRIANTVVFPSMATVGTQSKLASLKAVSPQYPLRGALQVQSPTTSIVSASPSTGSIFVDKAMLASLQAGLGDRITLGSRQFLIAGVLTQELDRGAGFMNFAPRVMMSLEDLPSTGLLGLGSRVTYRLLLAGADADIQSYEKWATNFINAEGIRGLRIETMENAQPIMRKTLERAERFLSLIALLTAMVSAVAISLSARRYVLKQADSCAVLKCFGASSGDILKKQFQTLISLGIIAAIVGSSIGYFVQYLLLSLLDNLVMGNLQSVSIWPVLWSTALAWILLIGFALPPLLGLVKVSPVRLIRKEYTRLSGSAIWVAIFGLVICLALIAIAARDWKLALWTAGSFGGAVALFGFMSWVSLRLLGKIRSQHFIVRFVLLTQSRSMGYAIVQITALGIAIMALLMILLLRQDLLSAWQSNIPPDAPNRFMINVQENQKQGIDQFLVDAGVGKPDFYPMVRGRLIDINGQAITPNDYQDENARRLVDREFNLSYVDQLPSGNRITAGKWIDGSAPQVSLEAGIAKTLKLKLGDQLTFEIAGEKISAPITSLRKLDWGSMRVNFFVIMPSSLLSQLPQSWITSYYQGPNKEDLDYRLTQTYPNLTVVDVANSLQQIQEVINKLTAALGLLFIFTIIAAILVLIAAISATQDERFRNAALLKALGASRKVLARIATLELFLIGAISGALAGIAAGIAAWALGRFVLEIEFQAFAQSILMGLVFGITACLMAGYRFQKKIQNATSIECLRTV
ncbi:ABC transporter permease [Polynucleobacter sp. AP-Melu-500A-A1]|uniref:ABC transporter permease n=1 Tax=Polynucleobacter sp. AP-Melu-500A-A1 TaxID=2576929 RepID=UPI001C0D8312|nr:FtsX-like permease family protein [Polynucleobacter sp. AP-Melu-500A-A1]MBU3630127.1 ABC transporter permease [Polynucleobacter sp. AP-Melu-500A-A1]